MNIAVINIKDIIKYAIIFTFVIIIVISGIIIAKGKEEFKTTSAKGMPENSSFLYCLEMEMPLMAEEKAKEDSKKENSSYKILQSELAILNNIEDEASLAPEDLEEMQEEIKEKREIEENQKIEIAENLETKIIDENNIQASYTDQNADIQIKNQSKYDVKDLMKNASYELKNKNKVIIYHTHTCESYTSSEKYPYEMTGAYRTTDLNYTVARVRR